VFVGFIEFVGKGQKAEKARTFIGFDGTRSVPGFGGKDGPWEPIPLSRRGCHVLHELGEEELILCALARENLDSGHGLNPQKQPLAEAPRSQRSHEDDTRTPEIESSRVRRAPPLGERTDR
jgi:hypothetical protein